MEGYSLLVDRSERLQRAHIHLVIDIIGKRSFAVDHATFQSENAAFGGPSQKKVAPSRHCKMEAGSRRMDTGSRKLKEHSHDFTYRAQMIVLNVYNATIDDLRRCTFLGRQ